jgi:hypothetical protein
MGARNRRRRHLHAVLTLVLRETCILYLTSEKLCLQVHGIEGVDGLVIVGLDLTCQKSFISPRSSGGASTIVEAV